MSGRPPKAAGIPLTDEERFRRLLLLAADRYWAQDAAFRFTEVVGTGVVPIGQLLGKLRWEIDGFLPLSGSWDAHRQQLEAHEPFHDFVYMRRLPGLPDAWISISGEPLFDANGDFAGYHGTSRDITQPVLAERALRESEERFRSLTELSSDWYWEQDAQLRFTMPSGNAAARRFMGPEAVGRCRWELPGAAPVEGTWDDHRRVIEGRQAFRDFVYVRDMPDGRRHYISVSGEPVFAADGAFLGYRGTSRDVTQAVLDQRALRESEERFRSLALLSSDWYWEQDAQLRFVEPSVNPSAQRFVGGGSVGLRRWEVPGAATLEGSWDAHRAQIEAHQPFRDFVYIRDMADGRRHYLSVSGEPVFGADGRFAGYRGTASDVTERINQQREILRLNADLEERVRLRTAQLEAANHELQAFGYSIAHDLRAPLATIDGFSQVLETTLAPTADARSRHLLARIRNAVRHMGDLADGLLALANLSREELRSEPVDIAVLARSAFEVCCGSDPRRQVDLQVPDSLPAVGDPRLLSQALGNLLGNAWKFTGHTTGARIEIGRTEHGGQPAFFVRDNGAGFDMAHAGKLFEAFHRLHTRAEFEGTGIGLAIVHRIVARHGGRVWAEAEPGKGACFWFTLPDERQRAP
jgi:PAS domain S-box-containing protein